MLAGISLLAVAARGGGGAGGGSDPLLEGLTLSASTVAENVSVGTTIGTVIGKSGSSTLELTGTAGGKLTLDGLALKTAASIDFETTPTLDWEITETLSGAINSPRASSGTINVTDVVDLTPPTITSSNAPSVAENVVLAHALTANESVTWSIRTAVQNAASVDHDKFELSGSTLRWAGNGTKDYESPDDADTNNTYVVVVRATDVEGNTTDQTITVTVGDESEGGGELYPDPTLDSTDYTATGGAATKPAGSILFAFAGQANSVSSSGDLTTAIVAALATTTAYTVEITVSDYVADSQGCRISLRGGAATIITPTGNGTFSGSVTTGGTGAGIVITGRDVDDGTSFRITDLSIT